MTRIIEASSNIILPRPLIFFITRIIAASSDIILLRPFSHIINLIHVINTRSIRMLEFYSHKGQNEFNLKISQNVSVPRQGSGLVINKTSSVAPEMIKIIIISQGICSQRFRFQNKLERFFQINEKLGSLYQIKKETSLRHGLPL